MIILKTVNFVQALTNVETVQRFKKKCKSCKKTGHFAKRCPKQKSVNQVQKGHTTSQSSNNDKEDDEFFIGSVSAEVEVDDTPIINDDSNCYSPDDDDVTATVMSIDGDDHSVNFSEWSVVLITNGSYVSYKIDSGAQVNILPKKEFYSSPNRPGLKDTKIRLKAYNSSSIPVLGRCVTQVKQKNRTVPVLFIVADTSSPPILGLTTSENLNLIKRVLKIDTTDIDFLAEYSDCFGQIGCLPGTHHIVLKDHMTPVIHAPRRVPVALRPKLKEELERMKKLDIIEPVNEPSDWVSSLVIVQKPNSSLRACLDPSDLNQAIKRHHLQLPTTDEILSQLSGACYFTELDASNGYWQVRLDDESSHLLAFNTPFGRHRFKRMIYGIHSASEVFQVKVAQIIEGIEECLNSQDDILIWADSKEGHDRRVHEVFSKVRASGLKLNKSKCVFGVTELKFLGHIISERGIEPDPEKVSAIVDMPLPTNKKELQRFLGMVNCLGKFLPNLSDVSALLRKLLKKDVKWCFDAPQIKSVQELKEMVTNNPVLKFYDIQLPTRVSSNVSTEGLGAVMEQQHPDGWFPVAFASRSLSVSEQNYCQLERETLSIVLPVNAFTIMYMEPNFKCEMTINHFVPFSTNQL